MEESNLENCENGEHVMDVYEADLQVLKFAEARAKEIDTLDYISKTNTGGACATQSVPKHMRRRAASHNIKRLPRRLRKKAFNELMVAPPKKGKRPSRKHRRRPSNLLQDYNRRKKRCMWLETHIWHAKRFHMEEMWGYKLAKFPNDKSLRACYRASNQHCLMWDMSYLNCIEIRGFEQHIITGLNVLSSPQTGQSFGSKSSINGCVESSVFMYAAKQYPEGAIGPVSYMWKPVILNSEQAERRILWLWTHPSTYKQLLKELETVFKANQVTTSKQQFKSQVTDIKANKQIEGNKKLSSGSVVSPNTKQSETNCDKLDAEFLDIDQAIYRGPDVEFISLKDTLCRYRLVGPQSQVILANILKVSSVKVENNENTECTKWWERFYSCDKAISLHNSQAIAWENVIKAVYPAYIPPKTVLGLTVRDPRITLPTNRVHVTVESHQEMSSLGNSRVEKTSMKGESKENCHQWPEISYSPIWESNVRKDVKESMMKEYEINKIRSENLLPGDDLHLGRIESRIPILLIHKPGNIAECVPTVATGSNKVQLNIEMFGSGWDIIVPSGWGMAFWIGLVFSGARVGGLRELCNTEFEGGQLNFPYYCPDTSAGKTVEALVKSKLQIQYNKKPPAKRPNYTKLGIAEPFQCYWNELCKTNVTQGCNNTESSLQNSEHSLFILRDNNQLQNLFHPLKNSSEMEGLVPDNINKQNLSVSLRDILPIPSCIVAIQVQMLQRGTCEPFAHICDVTTEDLYRIKANVNYRGPIEPLHKILKSGLITTTVDSIQEAAKKKKEIETSKQIIGYISYGGFSLKLGHGAGVGYISHHSLLKLLSNQNTLNPLVLIRIPTSLQYSFATVSVMSKNKICSM